ncbi:alpha/beta fold hydrolase [Muricauda oceani]|uniref:Alpha/beta fold hydrolase n=1 Tax=Flagellimonas oceani TaxID=2698672 RepID=A0A6G7IZZ8_9FLAO|nr:alpha/beta fold hydrolase [Allomuricauda oceani]MBW8243677.1 alpha/beta fold hydrolase [Allomuricauda oceani]QII43959.1 alpha/beta fold hydrolase [Allomuricauda oceani]
MKKRIVLLIIWLSTASLVAQDVTGAWGGTLDVQGTRLRVVFNVTEGPEGYITTLDSPDQGVKGMPVTTTEVDGPKITFGLPSARITYQGVLKDSSIVGTFTQHSQDFPLTLTKRTMEEMAVVRPQEPSEPYPYIAENVTFPNKNANITLAGTLTLPREKGPFPAVVLISGSGPQNRDEELMGHKPFLVLSDHLTRNGIAVLRYDDRGFGASTGDFASATSADFATDVVSAITYLKSRSEIDGKAIGLVGHSEGGLIAPMVAAGSKDVAFMVLMAGSGIRGDKLLLLQEELIERVLGTPEPEIKQMLETNGKLFDAIVNSKDDTRLKSELRDILEEEGAVTVPEGMTKVELISAQIGQFTSPWVKYFLRYDPSSNLGKVTCPVLAINGEKDLQVPPQENLSAIKKAINKGGNSNVTTREFKGLNHLFQEAETGSPLEYAKIEQTIAPVVLNAITAWIKTQTN